MQSTESTPQRKNGAMTLSRRSTIAFFTLVLICTIIAGVLYIFGTGINIETSLTSRLDRGFVVAGVLFTIIAVEIAILALWPRETGASAPTSDGPAPDAGVLLAPPELVGREYELEWLRVRVLGNSAAGVWAITALGGVGKTALVATFIKETFHKFAGVVALRANGVLKAESLRRELIKRLVPGGRQLLRQRGVTAKEQCEDLGKALGEARVHNHQVLIVIDNIEQPLGEDHEFAELLNTIQTAGTHIILTSRSALPGHFVRETLPLSTLGDDAIDLFVQRSGRFANSRPNEEERTQIADICRDLFQGHALAVVVAAAAFGQPKYRAMSLAAFHKQLEQSSDDLVGPDAPRGVSQAFSTSYDGLSQGAKRLFVALGCLCGRGCADPAILAIGRTLGQPTEEIQLNLGRLLESSLIQRAGEGGSADDTMRIELHPLVHRFASQLFKKRPIPEQNSLHTSLAKHYAAWVNEQHTLVALSLDDANLTAALEWTFAHIPRLDIVLGELTCGLRWYWYSRFELSTAFTWLETGYAALMRLTTTSSRFPFYRHLPFRRGPARDESGRKNVLAKQAAIAGALGMQYLLQGVLQDGAEKWYNRSLDICREIDDVEDMADVLCGIGASEQQRGKNDQAASRYEEALRLYTQTRNLEGQADVWYRRGFLALRIGDTAAAETYYQQSLKLYEDLSQNWGRGILQYSLGNVYQQIGDVSATRIYYGKGLESLQSLTYPDPRAEGMVLKALGDLELQTKGRSLAERNLTQSLKKFRDIYALQSQGVALYSIAFMHRQSGEVDLAETYYEMSRDIRKQVGDLRGLGFVMKSLGDLQRRRGKMIDAEKSLHEGITLSRQAQDRRNEGVALKAIGDWHWQAGHLDKAKSIYEQSLLVRESCNDLRGTAITRKALADLALATRGDVLSLTNELAHVYNLFLSLDDQRGVAATQHSQGILAIWQGDFQRAYEQLHLSLKGFEQVPDSQSLCVAMCGIGQYAESRGDITQAKEWYKLAHDKAQSIDAIGIRALSAEALGMLSMRESGHMQGAAGRQVLLDAASLYQTIARVDAAERIKTMLHQQTPEPAIVRIADWSLGFIYDLDEGPNGQGFAIPNDRKRAFDSPLVR